MARNAVRQTCEERLGMQIVTVSLGIPFSVLVALAGAILFLVPRRKRAAGLIFACGIFISGVACILPYTVNLPLQTIKKWLRCYCIEKSPSTNLLVNPFCEATRANLNCGNGVRMELD
jgi:hypothetical protein